MTESDAVADRRHRAMEAYWDADPSENPIIAGQDAVETATRVRITPEIIQAAREGWLSADGSWTEDPGPRQVARLAASFRAAGFEVET